MLFAHVSILLSIYRVTHEVVLQGFVYIKAKVAFECKEQKLKLIVDTGKVTGEYFGAG